MDTGALKCNIVLQNIFKRAICAAHGCSLRWLVAGSWKVSPYWWEARKHRCHHARCRLPANLLLSGAVKPPFSDPEQPESRWPRLQRQRDRRLMDLVTAVVEQAWRTMRWLLHASCSMFPCSWNASCCLALEWISQARLEYIQMQVNSSFFKTGCSSLSKQQLYSVRCTLVSICSIL